MYVIVIFLDVFKENMLANNTYTYNSLHLKKKNVFKLMFLPPSPHIQYLLFTPSSCFIDYWKVC